ncbi:unnamed protein product [Mytilus edulis]|uniref:Uncharacterized protein n=1 Tax=Mytilus edulis TaxID=6550 RepID=A0A8S3U6J0_MYTED|nr:unnamed protein product [Mytilus edulis]
MTVISKIQKLRAENRREQKRKWKQKSKNDQTKALSKSSSAIRKRRQREKDRNSKIEDIEKRAATTKRKHKSRTKKKDQISAKEIIEQTLRDRKTNRQRIWREKQKQKQPQSPVQLNLTTAEDKNDPFKNKMSRCRAVRKLKRALPVTPSKRVATVKAYLSTNKSPTAITLQRIGLVPSPEEIKESKLNASVVEDIKTFLSNEKLKRNDQSRASVEVLAASVSGPAVGNCRAKVDLAKKLGVPVRRITRGFRVRSRVLTSDKSSYEYVKRKTRSDKLSEEVRKMIYDFWCSPENSRQTGNKIDVKRVRIGIKTYCSHAVQILEKTQSEVFLSFQQTRPEIKISQRTFEKCKPYFIRAARPKDRTTCCCRYHLENKYLFQSFSSHRKQLIKDSRY